MSEEHKNFGDDIKDAANKAAEEAKKSAEEFKESWNEVTNHGENKKLLAGLLAIFVGSLGIHKFILGYNTEGIIMLLVSLGGAFLCGIPTSVVALIGIIEGIIYLTKSDEEFYQTYQLGKRSWF